MTGGWPFGDLRPFAFDGILIDPPWSYQMYSEKGYEKSPEAHYATMPDAALLEFPAGHLAAADGGVNMTPETWTDSWRPLHDRAFIVAEARLTPEMAAKYRELIAEAVFGRWSFRRFQETAIRELALPPSATSPPGES